MAMIFQAKQSLETTDPNVNDYQALLKIKFICTQDKENPNSNYEKYNKQVNSMITFLTWKTSSERTLKSFGLNVKGSDDFLKNFYQWYTKVTNAKKSFFMGFVKALVTRHNNPSAQASSKVIAFCQAMKSKSKKAYQFLMANGFGYTV